uniref:Uncharacterized protein n=1 Tax=Panagrellus redivivus TaxID=6233 RepID=A0A7E4VCL4_PANRE
MAVSTGAFLTRASTVEASLRVKFAIWTRRRGAVRDALCVAPSRFASCLLGPQPLFVPKLCCLPVALCLCFAPSASP